jgi:putative tryptophan/tyrosine transport system substrate-binding protein
VRRREFISLLGGATAAWPLAARAQQPVSGVRRIGVLVNLPPDNAEAQARMGAFLQGLQEFGWSIGRNVRIEYRWASNPSDLPRHAAELVTLAPDVLLANANPSVAALQKVSRTIPIVFVATTDPVGSGIAQSLAQPRGNATGFTTAEFGFSGKWLELLKDLAPNVKRVAVLQDPTSGSSSIAQFAAIQAVAPSLGVDLISLPLQEDRQIKEVVTGFARFSNTGLIATRTSAAISHRDLIIDLAARLRLPAVYPLRLFVTAGGLAAYGPDIVDEYRQAASYVDRILKGEKPGELPVQAPTKYELVLNLKTAKALGLQIPDKLLALADEVIE